MVDPGQLTCGAIGLGEVKGLEYFHLLLLGQHRGVPPWLDWSLPDPIDAKEGRSSGGSPWGDPCPSVGRFRGRPRGLLLSVRGEIQWPPMGSFARPPSAMPWTLSTFGSATARRLSISRPM